MADRPILFSTPLVQAILAGRKTMTRRPVKWPKWAGVERDWPALVESRALARYVDGRPVSLMQAPALPGDLLWVRETWGPCAGGVVYRADESSRVVCPDGGKWRPSIHMPRWAARIWLRVTDVRVERVQDITEEDARAEGFERREHFIRAWDEIYCGNGVYDPNGLGFTANPWIWAISFERCEAPAREGGR